MTTVDEPRIASRDEWLHERVQLLAREKDLSRRRDELARARRALPWVRVEQDYRFDTVDGERSLSELFDRCSQLVVYHFMFGPDWDQGCPSCSFWADNYNGTEHEVINDELRTPIEQFAQASFQGLGAKGDACQRIVDLMGDAGGQETDAGQTFRPHQLPAAIIHLLGQIAIHVAQAAAHVVERLGQILNQAAQDIYPAMILVGMFSVALCGWLMTLGLGWIERRTMPWKVF